MVVVHVGNDALLRCFVRAAGGFVRHGGKEVKADRRLPTRRVLDSLFAISYYEAPKSALVILHYALSAEAERRNALSWPSVKLLRRLMVRLQSCIF